MWLRLNQVSSVIIINIKLWTAGEFQTPTWWLYVHSCETLSCIGFWINLILIGSGFMFSFLCQRPKRNWNVVLFLSKGVKQMHVAPFIWMLHFGPWTTLFIHHLDVHFPHVRSKETYREDVTIKVFSHSLQLFCFKSEGCLSLQHLQQQKDPRSSCVSSSVAQPVPCFSSPPWHEVPEERMQRQANWMNDLGGVSFCREGNILHSS